MQRWRTMPRPKRRLPRPPRLPFPTKAEREYVALLQRRTKALRDFTMARLMPALNRATAALGVRTDDDRDEIDHLYSTLRNVRIEWEHQPAAQQLELPLGHTKGASEQQKAEAGRASGNVPGRDETLERLGKK